jgi:hypothetical protein
LTFQKQSGLETNILINSHIVIQGRAKFQPLNSIDEGIGMNKFETAICKSEEPSKASADLPHFA